MAESDKELVGSVKQMIVHTVSISRINHPEIEFDVEMFEDEWLIDRFLRARKYDLQATHDMLIVASKWRGEHKIKSYSKDGCSSEITTGKCRFYGVDRKGHPVCYIFPKLHHYNKQDPQEFERF